METINRSKETIFAVDTSVEELTHVSRPMVAMAKNFPAGHLIPSHSHDRSQLLYAASGVMTVSTKSGMWVVPPARAVWIPALTPHRIEVSGELAMRTLYILPEAAPHMPHQCCVVSVSALLRELILHAVQLPREYAFGGPDERIFKVILDQIEDLDTAPLALPLPQDARLRKICSHLSRNPSDRRSLSDWGKHVGATNRTLARLFRAQTNLSFGHWRRQIRILEALRRLGAGEPVTSVALSLGYDSPSAFISMFKKALGTTPGQYFKG